MKPCFRLVECYEKWWSEIKYTCLVELSEGAEAMSPQVVKVINFHDSSLISILFFLKNTEIHLSDTFLEYISEAHFLDMF